MDVKANTKGKGSNHHGIVFTHNTAIRRPSYHYHTTNIPNASKITRSLFQLKLN